jgi:hypothetical protein
MNQLICKNFSSNCHHSLLHASYLVRSGETGLRVKKWRYVKRVTGLSICHKIVICVFDWGDLFKLITSEREKNVKIEFRRHTIIFLFDLGFTGKIYSYLIKNYTFTSAYNKKVYQFIYYYFFEANKYYRH